MTGAAAAVLALAGACGGKAVETEPAIAILDSKGLAKRIERLRGAPLLVNFWASWCEPCCEEMPDLVAATQEFRRKGGAVLGIALECYVPDVTAAAGRQKVEALLPKLGIDFPVVVCSDGDFTAVDAALGFQVGALPQTLAWDRAGNLVEHHRGKATHDQFVRICARAER